MARRIVLALALSLAAACGGGSDGSDEAEAACQKYGEAVRIQAQGGSSESVRERLSAAHGDAARARRDDEQWSGLLTAVQNAEKAAHAGAAIAGRVAACR